LIFPCQVTSSRPLSVASSRWAVRKSEWTVPLQGQPLAPHFTNSSNDFELFSPIGMDCPSSGAALGT